MSEPVFRYLHYMEAQANARAAYNAYCHTAAALDNARAVERNAELASQAFTHVAKGELHKRLGDITDREREIGLAFARYTVCGRTDEP